MADLIIVVAYVISVALYIRILSQYALEYIDINSLRAEQLMSSAVIAGIGAVGFVRGFGGLTWLERLALGAGLALNGTSSAQAASANDLQVWQIANATGPLTNQATYVVGVDESGADCDFYVRGVFQNQN